MQYYVDLAFKIFLSSIGLFVLMFLVGTIFAISKKEPHGLILIILSFLVLITGIIVGAFAVIVGAWI